MKVLAGDIGGTKTLLCLAEYSGGTLSPGLERRYASADFPNLGPMIQSFLKTVGDAAAGLSAACLAVAGPVTEEGGRQISQITNLPWRLDSQALARDLELPHVRLINDFQAVAYGIDTLPKDELDTLQPGVDQPGALRAVIGAGTGLGQALLVWQGEHYEAYPTEGGHVDFAPTNDTQMALLRYLKQEFPHVSVERVLSGPGLVRIYSFLRDREDGEESQELRRAMRHGDPAAAISAFALDHRNRLADRALDLFVTIYGAQAGNLALSTLARGGLYIAGGIAPKIQERLRQGPFLKAFLDKGRMRHQLEQIPVRIVLNPRVGLWGAALAATRL